MKGMSWVLLALMLGIAYKKLILFTWSRDLGERAIQSRARPLMPDLSQVNFPKAQAKRRTG